MTSLVAPAAVVGLTSKKRMTNFVTPAVVAPECKEVPQELDDPDDPDMPDLIDELELNKDHVRKYENIDWSSLLQDRTAPRGVEVFYRHERKKPTSVVSKGGEAKLAIMSRIVAVAFIRCPLADGTNRIHYQFCIFNENKPGDWRRVLKKTIVYTALKRLQKKPRVLVVAPQDLIILHDLIRKDCHRKEHPMNPIECNE